MKKESSGEPKITPFLWFNGNGEEAMNFYVSVFTNSRIVSVMRMPPGGHLPEGSLLSATFELEGQRFLALNGGPEFAFTPAISMFVNCKTQDEVDMLWAKLTEGGKEQPCGWLVDKYGLSWQIIPSVLGELLQHKDREKAGRAMQAMMKMKKIDIVTLQNAFHQA